MATQDNLLAAFAGESQANRKYLAFAEKADKEGFAQVARLFRAAAAAETIHAHAHLRVMDGIRSTAENLREAVSGENYEWTRMYPEFIAEAEREGQKAALLSFRYANEVEKVHETLYAKALESVQTGNDLPAAKICVCPICGHTVEGDAPDKCPVCGAKGALYREVV